MKFKKLLNYFPAFMILLTFVAVWEIGVRVAGVSDNILPAPSLIITFSVPYWKELLGHALQTMLEAILGLLAAIGFGVITAIALDASASVRKALYPLLVSSQTIPIIALSPLLLIWIGYGLLPKVIIVTLYCFFPITIAMAGGLAAVDSQQINLFRSMRASNLQILRLVKIPSAMPSFFSGLKIAVTYSMIGAIVGEYVGAYKGLGIFIQTSANAHAIPLVFAAIFVTAIVSLMLFGLVGLIERKMLPWHYRK